jgi:hypothetical protein
MGQKQAIIKDSSSYLCIPTVFIHFNEYGNYKESTL